jgi:Domain of unknown function (DUF5615)
LKPRVYLDEDISSLLGPLCRDAGFDVISAREIGAVGETDRQQLARAVADGRALFTFNFHDFDAIAREEAVASRDHAGIIVSYHQYSTNEIGQLARALISFLERHSAEDLRNAYRVLTPPDMG